MSDHSWGPQGMPLAMSLTAVAGFSLTPVFARELSIAGMAPEIIAFWRFAVMGLLLLPFLALRGGLLRATGAGMVVGGAIGVAWIAYVVVLQKMGLLLAATLYLSYPLFLMFLVWGLLNILPGARSALSALLVFAAFAILLQRSETYIGLPWVSLALTVVAPVAFAFALTIQRGWLRDLSPIQRLSSMALGATLALAPFVFFHPADEVLPTGRTVIYVVGLAVVATLVPQVLQVIAAHRIGPLRSAVSVSFEVPLITMLGLFIYSERASIFELIAAFCVIGALVVNALSKQPHGRPPMA